MRYKTNGTGDEWWVLKWDYKAGEWARYFGPFDSEGEANYKKEKLEKKLSHKKRRRVYGGPNRSTQRY